MDEFEALFERHMIRVCDENPDPSHDILHVKRVVGLAKKIGTAERANLDIVIPAAYLHDCVYISKVDERRSRASQISADKAIGLLREWHYPDEFYSPIHHAISAHSFSAKIPVKTIEAKVVQDADR
ncbi:MAG: HD domain-containing protein [Pseudobdellovibrionaceae bacterium]